MCLYIKKEEGKDKIEDYFKVAEEDITVYKILDKKKILWGLFTRYYAPFRDNRYKLGRTYRAKIQEDSDNSTSQYLVIGPGIHAYKCNTWIKHEFYIPCIIPKGSIYAEDTYEIVTNTLKLPKKV